MRRATSSIKTRTDNFRFRKRGPSWCPGRRRSVLSVSAVAPGWILFSPHYEEGEGADRLCDLQINDTLMMSVTTGILRIPVLYSGKALLVVCLYVSSQDYMALIFLYVCAKAL